jgi:hypothetical protein
MQEFVRLKKNRSRLNPRLICNNKTMMIKQFFILKLYKLNKTANINKFPPCKIKFLVSKQKISKE